MKIQKTSLALIFMLSVLYTALGQGYEKKLNAMGIQLYPAQKPIANYVKAVREGNLIFLAGHGPLKPDGSSVKGRLGEDMDVKQGAEAARYAAVALLSSLKAEIGNLDKVKRIIKVTGMVNSSPDFHDHPKVINGCSDLLVAVFGSKGKHARAAVGMASLPFNIAVEIEMIVAIEEKGK